MAVFPFPEKIDLGDPAALGKAFAQFLRAQMFKARRAVIGMPVEWLMIRQQAVPPVEGAALSNLLRIQAERAFSHDGKDLAVDYIAQDGDGAKGSVLLFAALKQRVDQTLAFAEAAGLSVQSITSSTMTLALAGVQGSSPLPELVMQVIPGSVELAVRMERVEEWFVAALAVGVPMAFEGFPPCVAPKIPVRRLSQQVPGEPCSECAGPPRCSGLPLDYARVFGTPRIP